MPQLTERQSRDNFLGATSECNRTLSVINNLTSVIPAKAGIYGVSRRCIDVDSRLRGNDSYEMERWPSG